MNRRLQRFTQAIVMWTKRKLIVRRKEGICFIREESLHMLELEAGKLPMFQ